MTTARLIFSFYLVFVASLYGSPAYADEKVEKLIQVHINMELDPQSAMALFMSSSGTRQRAVQSLERVNPSVVVASIPYLESDFTRDTVVTAMALSKDGQPFFANVRPLFTSDPAESFHSLPLCLPEKASEAAMQGQLSLLESLVEVRAARRSVAQVKLAKVLDGKLLADLRKLEKGFGFFYPEELNSNLNPFMLLDRLSRLSDSIANAQKKPLSKLSE